MPSLGGPTFKKNLSIPGKIITSIQLVFQSKVFCHLSHDYKKNKNRFQYCGTDRTNNYLSKEVLRNKKDLKCKKYIDIVTVFFIFYKKTFLLYIANMATFVILWHPVTILVSDFTNHDNLTCSKSRNVHNNTHIHLP